MHQLILFSAMENKYVRRFIINLHPGMHVDVDRRRSPQLLPYSEMHHGHSLTSCEIS